MDLGTPGLTQLARQSDDGPELVVAYSHQVEVPIEVTCGCESLTVFEGDVPWLVDALHRAAGHRRDRLLVIVGTSALDVISGTRGAAPLLADSDTVVAVDTLGRATVIKSRLADTLEVGVLRLG